MTQNKLKQTEILDGIYLVHPYGLYFTKKKISAFVKANDMPIEKQYFYLCSKKYVYGIIRIRNKKEISLNEFKRFFPYHKIEDIYRIIWWGDRSLYYYDFDTIKIFKEPKQYVYTGGTRLSIIKNVKFK